MLSRGLDIALFTLLLWSIAQLTQARVRRRYRQLRRAIPGYCRPTVFMLMKGQRRSVPVGKTVKPNLCVDCTCNSSGSFDCCLSRKNAGKTFIYPGSLCTRCKCADLPYSNDFFLPDSVLEQHCFRGNDLMTCETSVCIHPLASDPNCIEITSSNEECCARCVRSGCYVMLNGTSMEAQNNQLAIDNYHRDGVEMLKLEFGESIHVGCIRGSCLPPDFMFSGGFVKDNSSCVTDSHGFPEQFPPH